MIRWMVLIIMIQVYAVFCLPLIAEPGSRGTGRVSSISTFYPISPGIGEVQLKRAKTRFQLKRDFMRGNPGKRARAGQFAEHPTICNLFNLLL